MIKVCWFLIIFMGSLFGQTDQGVGEEPPIEKYEIVTPSPGPNYVWMKGHWRWFGGWVWVPGHWINKPYAQSTWTPGLWVRKNRHWVWVPGHWDNN